MMMLMPDLSSKKNVQHFLQITRQTMATYMKEGIIKEDVHYYLDDNENEVFIPEEIIKLKAFGFRKQPNKAKSENANRVLAKVSYVVHTNAIKSVIVPSLTEKQKKYVYAEEADVLNVALFGMTAKEWRESNPEMADKGSIRDYTDLLHLVILNNLENINAELVHMDIPQNERLIRLNNIARKQMELLKNNKTFNNLEYMENKVNDEQTLIM